MSLEVIPPPEVDFSGASLQVEVGASPGQELGEAHFAPYGIGGRSQATLLWVWDTANNSAGDYVLRFTIQPGGVTWTETVSLFPANQVPPPEPEAAWATTESDCCLIYYITGTPAERDLPELVDMVDHNVENAKRLLDVGLNEPISITFLPRVLGHGGFANQEVAVSYLDRNYAGRDTEIVLHHEVVHILDNYLGGELRPALLVEGLAVYLSGGHFKPEPLMLRAAALLPPAPGCVSWASSISGSGPLPEGSGCGLDWYLPLDKLMDNFYFEQHEVGYLEAGALVEFMLERWGWEAYSDFYRHISPQPEPQEGSRKNDGSQSRDFEAALMARFGIALGQLESQFLEALRREDLTPANAEDVRLTVEFYEAVRRYQQILDPSAYFLSAWMPDSEQMRQRAIVADYLRRPSAPENLALETMLVAADGDLRQGDFSGADRMLSAVNSVLDSYSSAGAQPFAAHPLAADYLAVVITAQASSYQPHSIVVNQNLARVWVSVSGLELLELDFIRRQYGWTRAQIMGIGRPAIP